MNAAGARASSPPDSSGLPVTDAPSGSEVRPPRRILGVVLFALGIAGLAAILRVVGWPAVAANLAAIRWWFLALILIHGGTQLAFASGWTALIGPLRESGIRFGDAFAAYLAGDSVNYFTTVGGEPLKAKLVARKIGYPDAIATLTVHRHAEVASQGIFLALGIGITLTHYRVPAGIRIAAVGGMLLLAGAALGMMVALRRGAVVGILDRLSRFHALHRLQRFAHAAVRLDERIREFYGRRRDRFLASLGWCFLGWCGGLLETYVVVRLIAPGEGWITAVAIDSLALALNNAVLFIPARLGIAEGVRVGVFLLLGLSAAQGAAYGLARRAREILWLVPGLVVLMKRHLLDLRRLQIAEPARNEGSAG